MLILASVSARRQSLLAQVALLFTVEASPYIEGRVRSHPKQEVLRRAYEKAHAVAARHANEEAVVLGADTVVAVDSEVFGKPMDEVDARRMLLRLSGRVHRVWTGYAIMDCVSGKERKAVVSANVRFHDLTRNDIDRYVESGEPFDKAGGYGVQGRGALLVSSIIGDFYAVVGLPISSVARDLREFGIHPQG